MCGAVDAGNFYRISAIFFSRDFANKYCKWTLFASQNIFFCLGDLLYTTDIAQLRYEVIGSVEEMTQHIADAASLTKPVSRMFRSTIKDTLCISPIARCSYTHGSRQDFLLGDGWVGAGEQLENLLSNSGLSC